MKKSIALIASTLVGFSAVSAQDMSVTATVGAESLYVFRGVQLANSISTTAIDVAYGDFYFGAWAAFPITRSTLDGVEPDNEIDYYAGYGFALNDVLSLDAGFTYYTYPNAADFLKSGNTFETYVGMSFELPFSPSVYGYYDFDLKNWTFEASAGESWEVADNTSFDMGVFLGHVLVDGGQNYTYYGATTGVTYSFTENASFSVGLNWSGATEDYLNRKNNKFWTAASLTVGF
jgi:hypothetical protein